MWPTLNSLPAKALTSCWPLGHPIARGGRKVRRAEPRQKDHLSDRFTEQSSRQASGTVTVLDAVIPIPWSTGARGFAQEPPGRLVRIGSVPVVGERFVSVRSGGV